MKKNDGDTIGSLVWGIGGMLALAGLVALAAVMGGWWCVAAGAGVTLAAFGVACVVAGKRGDAGIRRGG